MPIPWPYKEMHTEVSTKKKKKEKLWQKHTHTSPKRGVWCMKPERPSSTEWPCQNRVRQLCVMQQATEREQLFGHQGEATGSSCIAGSPLSWLEHSCHISRKLNSTIIVQSALATTVYNCWQLVWSISTQWSQAYVSRKCCNVVRNTPPPLRWIYDLGT